MYQLLFFYCLNFAHKKMLQNVEEVTIEQREWNPELNTKNYYMHERKLEKFSKSKYKKLFSIQELMVLTTVIQPLEGKFFADG